jgi:hypothetical protein
VLQVLLSSQAWLLNTVVNNRYLLATTYTSVVYARNEGIPESALWSPDTPFLDIGLVVSLVLDGGFLVLCCLKLYVGTHSLWLSALGWLPHIFHLIAVAQRNENANPHTQVILIPLVPLSHHSPTLL